MGRPELVPSEEQRSQVRAMAAYGLPHEVIAKIVKLDTKTLRKHFSHELDFGAHEANAKVAQALFQRATQDKTSAGVQAAIFWLRCRAKWREATPEEATQAEEEIGKKAQRELDAIDAEKGTDWETLLH